MTFESSEDAVSKQAAIDVALEFVVEYLGGAFDEDLQVELKKRIEGLPSVQPDENSVTALNLYRKYEYHYDHTDCIWYRPEARNRCPTTCAQYRDGWNDAMNYIFRDGAGYRPFRRDQKYE